MTTSLYHIIHTDDGCDASNGRFREACLTAGRPCRSASLDTHFGRSDFLTYDGCSCIPSRKLPLFTLARMTKKCD